MPRRSRAIAGLPCKVVDLIARIGRDLRVSRLRRGVSQRDLAERMSVSPQTLQRIENGDPAVSIGILLTCAFCLDRLGEVSDMLATKNDVYGNILENRKRMLQRKARAADRDEEDDLDF